MNTWPDGHRRPMYQSEHESWNAQNYPGTRQLCCKCDEPTGRCEDDSLYINDDDGPYCPECWEWTINALNEHADQQQETNQ